MRHHSNADRQLRTSSITAADKRRGGLISDFEMYVLAAGILLGLASLFWSPTTWAYRPLHPAESRWLPAAVTTAERPATALRSLPPLVTSVEAVGMTVSDMDHSVQFFSRVLSFQKVSDVEIAGGEAEHLEGVFGLRMRVVRLRLGAEFLDLTEYLAPRGKPIPPDSKSNDRWFQHIAIITSDMDRAYQVLRQNRVEHASSGPQRLPDWNKNAGGIRAFYFKDPDGHPLEVLQFPPDKGQARWHEQAGRLFLGIDHTAIVVADTDASLRFYRDTLGFRIAGESENYGEEQEHLNNVFGARLRITSLRAAAGPGIEFLEYLTPRDGRPFPPELRANDIAHWQTSLDVEDAGAAAQGLLAARYSFISPGLVDLPVGEMGFKRALMVRDPDGHAMQIVEKLRGDK